VPRPSIGISPLYGQSSTAGSLSDIRHVFGLSPKRGC